MTNAPEEQVRRLRASAGQMDIGIPEEGPINDVFEIGDARLILIKSTACYEFYFADVIDPDRTNPAMPNVQQKVLSAGSESLVVQKMLMNPKLLLRADFLTDQLASGARKAVLAAVQEALSMERISLQIKLAQSEIEERYSAERLRNGLIVPSLDDFVQLTKNFFNRADHVLRELHSITKLFIPNYGNLDKLRKQVLPRSKIDDQTRDFFRSGYSLGPRFHRFLASRHGLGDAAQLMPLAARRWSFWISSVGHARRCRSKVLPDLP